MSILEQIQTDVRQSMRDGHREQTQALRMLVSELQKDAKEGRNDEIAVLQRERKRRQEARQGWLDAGRPESAESEQREIDLIAGYLPTPLSEDELHVLVDQALIATGATSPRDMGKVMAHLKPLVAGRADGKTLSTIVKSRLA